MDPYSRFGLDVKTDDDTHTHTTHTHTHIPQESMKSFITQIKRLSGESKMELPSWSKNGLREQGRETGFLL